MPELAPDLAALFKRAAWIGQNADVGSVSASSLFLAMMCMSDPWSRWAQAAAKRTGVRRERILERWGETGRRPADFSMERLRRRRSTPEVVEAKLDVSAEWLFDLLPANKVLGVRHLIGAYAVANGHDDDFTAWGLNRERWAALFVPRHRRLHPDDSAFPGITLREYSIGIIEALGWAGALSKGRPVSARDLALGVLVDGARYVGNREYSCAWLFTQLGGDLEVLLKRSVPDAPVPSVELDESAHELLDQAALFATACRDQQIHVRHLLLGSLAGGQFPPEILWRGRRGPQLADDLLSWHFNRLGDAPKDDPAALQELFTLARAAQARSEPRAAVLDNDEAHGKDALEVQKDAWAMASVLASRKLKPPLSVGLFGDWGSGKSFFMQMLHKRIKQLARRSRAARRDGGRSAYHRRIVQVDFNAWQYMDANFWASFTAHLFDRLAEDLDRKGMDQYVRELASLKEQEAALTSERDELGLRIGALEKQVQGYREAREKKEVGLRDTAKALLQAAVEEEEIAKELGSISALGLSQAAVTVQTAKQEREEIRKLGAAAAGWKIKGWRKGALVGLLVVVPPALWWAAVYAWALVPVALLPAGISWAWARGLVAKAIHTIDRAIARANEVEAKVRELKPEEAKLQKESQQLDEERLALERKQADLQQRRAEVEAWLESKKDTVSYKRFVLDRAASTDYRSKLGLIHTIHRDLKDLSDKLKDHREPRVDRIILYIDDLDRCPPDRVVEVLQAVHLILSLPLFVVVVAVDSRWLLQSLEAYYEKHFGKRRHRSDPQHYLEKIFQVPYAIAPMTETGFGSLVRSLLGGSVVTTVQARAGTMRMGDRLSELKPALPESAPATAQSRDSTNLTPRNLDVHKEEFENLRRLHELLPSPRAAKRMINIYRIVRAGLDEDAIEELLSDERYRLLQLFLACVVGAPKETATLCDRMFDGRITSREQLVQFLQPRAKRPDAWGAIARAFAAEELPEVWDEIVDAARSAARFSFQTGRVLQPLKASPGTPGPPPSEKPPPS